MERWLNSYDIFKPVSEPLLDFISEADKDILNKSALSKTYSKRWRDILKLSNLSGFYEDILDRSENRFEKSLSEIPEFDPNLYVKIIIVEGNVKSK